MTRETVITLLLRSYEAYYNITKYEESEAPLVARCDFFEEAQKYVLSRKAELWHAQSEAFVYLFQLPNLTCHALEQCKNLAIEDGMKRLNIGPGHMVSYITTIIICDSCDPDAFASLKKFHLHKNFKFSIHGWMTYQQAMILCDANQIISNRAGKSTATMLKNILFPNQKRRGIK